MKKNFILLQNWNGHFAGEPVEVPENLLYQFENSMVGIEVKQEVVEAKNKMIVPEYDNVKIPKVKKEPKVKKQK